MQQLYESIAVVGAGAMGRGIAQIAAQAGCTVYLFDNQPEAVSSAIEAVHAQWDRLHDKGKLSTVGRYRRRSAARGRGQ